MKMKPGRKINYRRLIYIPFKNDFTVQTDKMSYRFGETIGMTVTARAEAISN